MKLADTDVLVLCGGQGTRLRGVLPKGTPKCLADINGSPFIDILTKQLASFRRILFAAGYGWIMLDEHLGGAYRDGRLYTEASQSGTGRPIDFIRKREGDNLSDPFFVINGDTFCELDHVAILQNHLKSFAEVTAPYDTQYRSVGTYLLSKKAVSIAAETLGPKWNIDDAFAVWPKKKVLVNWYPTLVKYWDIGSPEALTAFREYWKTRK